jgi:hypothetical protein
MYCDETYKREHFTYALKPQKLVGALQPNIVWHHFSRVMHLVYLFWPFDVLLVNVNETNHYSTIENGDGETKGGFKIEYYILC